MSHWPLTGLVTSLVGGSIRRVFLTGVLGSNDTCSYLLPKIGYYPVRQRLWV